MSTLTGIAVRTRTRAPMQPLDACLITPEQGLAGDHRGRPGRRQVTVLSAEAWQNACEAVGTDLPWLTRRANLLVSGMRFGPQDVGRVLQFGDVRLQITRETDPCQRMDEACPGLREALAPEWRGGVCCRVLTGGLVRLGDEVSLHSRQE
ncbi:MAG: molybdenum cofactor biosysynthesis protein [Porticoccaceae bacterium]|nr:molybdenum cofactor biosysynthesis protein [Porticoccaceae bacterium]